MRLEFTVVSVKMNVARDYTEIVKTIDREKPNIVRAFLSKTFWGAALDREGEPEIDAIADVAPAPSFRNWIDANYVFTERPSIAKNTVCANGVQAFVNAAFGFAPDAPAPPAWSIESFEPTTRTLVAPFAPYASDLVRVQASSTLTNAAWTVSLPLWAGTNSLGRPLLRIQDPTTEAAPTAFFRLKLVD